MRNNKRRRYPNYNQENYLSESSVTTRSDIGGYGRTKTGGTDQIFISRILTESEYASTGNTNTHTNYGRIYISYLIHSYNYSDEG